MAPPQHKQQVQEWLIHEYGNLAEGYQAVGTINRGRLEVLKRQFQNRRLLATYFHYPEGYEFAHEADDNKHRLKDKPAERHAVILLSPPDLIAVQHSNGTWTRRFRRSEDGPEPYTQAWYHRYLVEHYLPLWFLRPEHTASLHSNAEANALGVPALPAVIPPPANYLKARYPFQPLYPVDQLERYGEHAMELTSERVRSLARSFPAVVVHAARRRAVVWVVGGGILIRDQEDVVPAHHQQAATRQVDNAETWEKVGPISAASYRVPVHLTTNDPNGAPVLPFRLPPESRDQEIAAAKDNGAFPLEEVPRVQGEWRWLNDQIDEPLASALFLRNRREVITAIQNRLLIAGTDNAYAPRVTFVPDSRYFNPSEQPAGHGRWEYFTAFNALTSEQAQAWEALSRVDPYFTNDEQPTAEKVWRCRQDIKAQNDSGNPTPDITENINLVWIPSEAPVPREDEPMAGDDNDPLGDLNRLDTENHEDNDADDDADDTDDEDGEGDDDDDAEDDNAGPSDPDRVDERSGLTHDPTNRGENDQTATSQVYHYQTRMINGSKCTVDRARAHEKIIEPHKSWIVNNRGQWVQFKQYANVDWDDKKSVEKMNKWREQEFTRHEWPSKRRDKRQDYPRDQQEWMFERVKAASGARPETSIANLTKEFNQHFGTNRKDTGIASLLDRCRKRYKQHGADFVPGVGRGNRKDRGKGLSSALVVESDDEEEDGEVAGPAAEETAEAEEEEEEAEAEAEAPQGGDPMEE